MGSNCPRDNGKVFFIFRVLMNIDGIHSPFLWFLFPVGCEITGGKLPVVEGERDSTINPSAQDTPKYGSHFSNPNAFPFCPTAQKLLQIESI